MAVAEHLPICANAVDAALAVLTIHHWSDVDAGVAEMIRVARRRIVILTWDHTVFRQFWLLREYLPAAAEMDVRLAVPITKLLSLLGNASIQTVPIPYDCADGFGGAYWRSSRQAAAPARRRQSRADGRTGLRAASADRRDVRAATSWRGVRQASSLASLSASSLVS
jgi:hypothetical protein